MVAGRVTSTDEANLLENILLKKKKQVISRFGLLLETLISQHNKIVGFARLTLLVLQDNVQ